METIYGKTQGLKAHQLKQLERLYRTRLSQDSLTTPELAQRLAMVSAELKESICIYLNRRGQVIRVAIGTPNQTKIPPLELPRYGSDRLSGLRCIWVTPDPEPPNTTDLTAMLMQRLDALVILPVNPKGYTERGYLAHLLPATDTELPEKQEAWRVSKPMTLDSLCKQDFLELVEGLEEEFSRNFAGRATDDDQDRVVLVGLMMQKEKSDAMPFSLIELGHLVESAGGKVLDALWQKRERPHPQTVLGEGKVLELAIAAQTKGANLVVFDRELTASQTRNLERMIGLRVSDRTEVILDIFAQRAQTSEGKLQVELAQLEYRLPRLAGHGQALSRLGGGIGTRGPGETKLETDRRVIQKRITFLQQQVNRLQEQRSRIRQKRVDQEVPTVAIVGYTNAGKSTLLNAMTRSDVYAADKLFATLDPTTRRLSLTGEYGKIHTVLLTDTVGFIHELPHSLVDAFRATLEEVSEADVLVHLVDASHAAWEDQLKAVDKILKDMPIAVGPTLLVFNKIDAVPEPQTILEKYPEAIAISALKRQGFEQMSKSLLKLIEYAIGKLN
ncbi:MAG: GTPase HflX [Pseudanabaena sp. M158S2SP1A06QC]|nr:GTPase HflX [Pseudanabaena sp. M53BS1SP1A06MG]MCA6585210.1 GTPase HflX [Pseudanabaena sp. M051S1SP1A06QC]MCA6588985.1 GTPase HflX [Pseudanabaena sp. M109S1SP1A06QC]MCA6592667.1 GTPase HflX [Pseudanabaena sp. M38BS1SP1A06MG]MCA6596605.1 GTPase HflX [Pseudanabaena sp. M046S1SP1A06QC]MCA6604988.1 GTPase HflX [Pseudanabaena sp. M007S1SP1A06QC]MCA6612587.1 GTPase HflX [Pseudanabaena sp. M158S2SP1A06QC]MCA6614919.1 GTPase HflX [Pseudanabaena sp. M090S1SP1A06QC]MCA6623024.1 GTPase HflX [Pseudan